MDDDVRPKIIVEIDIDLENFNGTKLNLFYLNPSLARGGRDFERDFERKRERNRERHAEPPVPCITYDIYQESLSDPRS